MRAHNNMNMQSRNAQLQLSGAVFSRILLARLFQSHPCCDAIAILAGATRRLDMLSGLQWRAALASVAVPCNACMAIGSTQAIG